MTKSLADLFALLSKTERRSFTVFLVLLVFNAGLEMLSVGVIPLFISALAYPEKLAAQPLIGEIISANTDSRSILYAGSVVLLVVFASRTAFSILVAFYKAKFVSNVVASISERLFSAYLGAPYTFHTSRNSAELVRNLNVECNQLGNKILLPLMDGLTQCAIFIAISALVLTQLPTIGLVWALGFILASAILGVALQIKVRDFGFEAQDGRMSVLRRIHEAFGSLKELRILGRERYFVDAYAKVIRRMLYITRYVQVLQKAVPILLELLSVLALIGLVVLLSIGGHSTSEIVTTVVLFAVAAVRLKSSSAGIISNITNLRHTMMSVDVISSDLRYLVENNSAWSLDRVADDVALRLPFANEVVLDSVSYTYPDRDEPALVDVTTRIRRGQAVGIVGSTGAGKSTLMDLLLGILPPSSGSISVDGFDISGAPRRWSNSIGFVPQDIYLIDGTIRQNIALGLAGDQVDEQSVQLAVRSAQLDKLLEQLPQGLDTVVGERGVRLSGGQRQRIGIARALYRGPEVLVLDEATSALDNVTEQAVMAAVSALKGQRTIIMIAHRLTTVRNCDEILFLESGRVCAEGSYDQLMASCQAFRALAGATEPLAQGEDIDSPDVEGIEAYAKS